MLYANYFNYVVYGISSPNFSIAQQKWCLGNYIWRKNLWKL